MPPENPFNFYRMMVIPVKLLRQLWLLQSVKEGMGSWVGAMKMNGWSVAGMRYSAAV